jgi:hypothetical protein
MVAWHESLRMAREVRAMAEMLDQIILEEISMFRNPDSQSV